MRLGQRGGVDSKRREGREMHRGGGTGEEEFSSSSHPGSGCSGAPQGWSAPFRALLVSLRTG